MMATKEEVSDALVDCLKNTQLGREGMIPLGMLDAPFTQECLQEHLAAGRIKVIPPSPLDRLVNGCKRYGIPGESYPESFEQIQIYRNTPTIGVRFFKKLE